MKVHFFVNHVFCLASNTETLMKKPSASVVCYVTLLGDTPILSISGFVKMTSDNDTCSCVGVQEQEEIGHRVEMASFTK